MPNYTPEQHSAQLGAPSGGKVSSYPPEQHSAQLAAPNQRKRAGFHTRAKFCMTKPPQLAAPGQGRKASLHTKAIVRCISSPKPTEIKRFTQQRNSLAHYQPQGNGKKKKIFELHTKQHSAQLAPPSGGRKVALPTKTAFHTTSSPKPTEKTRITHQSNILHD